MKLISHPIGTDVFGNAIQKCLREAPKGGLFRVAIAYVSVSGIKKFEKHLKKFIDQNGTVEIIAGIDIGDDPVKGIQEVLRICGPGSVFIFWNPAGYTFHPKVYCLTDTRMKGGSFWIGSSNFTEKGLFKNYECSIQLQVSDRDNHSLLDQINKYFVDLRKSPFCQPATKALLKPLLKIEKKRKRQGDRLSPTQVPPEIRDKFTSKIKRNKLGKGFTMLLSHNDVSGKRYEPYFLIPVRARDENPHFWGWHDDFSPSKQSGMPERRIVTKIHLKGTTSIENKRIYWVEKRDEFRFVSPTIYQLGKSFVGNILHVKRTTKGYDIHVIPPTDSRFSILIKYAVNLSSYQKKWGYIL
jgi:HKD family nuclease